MRAGVPQGSVLGSTLYSIYTHDISKRKNVALALFADDVAVITQFKSHQVLTTNNHRFRQMVSQMEDRNK